MSTNNNQKDSQLIKAYLNGNKASFSCLLKKYLKPIYNFLYQLTNKDKALTDDLTQETFIKTWKKISKFKLEKSFKTWLFTIAKNTAFDYFKKKKTIPFSFFEDDQGNNKLEKIAEDSILPDEIMNRKDLAEEMEKKLDQIPEGYRIILTLRYKEDFSLQEIAQILDKPYNTIKSQHQRALVKLRKILKLFYD